MLATLPTHDLAALSSMIENKGLVERLLVRLGCKDLLADPNINLVVSLL